MFSGYDFNVASPQRKSGMFSGAGSGLGGLGNAGGFGQNGFGLGVAGPGAGPVLPAAPLQVNMPPVPAAPQKPANTYGFGKWGR